MEEISFPNRCAIKKDRFYHLRIQKMKTVKRQKVAEELELGADKPKSYQENRLIDAIIKSSNYNQNIRCVNTYRTTAMVSRCDGGEESTVTNKGPQTCSVNQSLYCTTEQLVTIVHRT